MHGTGSAGRQDDCDHDLREKHHNSRWRLVRPVCHLHLGQSLPAVIVTSRMKYDVIKVKLVACQ